MNMPVRRQAMSGIRVTPEAKEAMDGLPDYISRPKFLHRHGLIDVAHSVNWTVSSNWPQQNVHVRSVRIINLCNAYHEYTGPLDEIEFDRL